MMHMGGAKEPPVAAELVPADGRVPLRVLSFNIWVNGGRSLRSTIDAIAACHADIVCLQECSPPAAKLIARALGLYCADENSTLSRFPIAPVTGLRTKHNRSEGWGSP